jgi:hypothetical protein
MTTGNLNLSLDELISLRQEEDEKKTRERRQKSYRGREGYGSRRGDYGSRPSFSGKGESSRKVSGDTNRRW